MTVLRFGSYRGKSLKGGTIDSVPIHYCLWLLGQRWFRQKYPELYPMARRRAMQQFEAEIAAEEAAWRGRRDGTDLV